MLKYKLPSPLRRETYLRIQLTYLINSLMTLNNTSRIPQAYEETLKELEELKTYNYRGFSQCDLNDDSEYSF